MKGCDKKNNEWRLMNDTNGYTNGIVYELESELNLTLSTDLTLGTHLGRWSPRRPVVTLG